MEGLGIDLESLKISQSFADSLGVKKLLTTVPVKKPNKQHYVRIHPDEAFRIPVALIELKDNGEYYLVHPDIRDFLTTEVTPYFLFTTINRQGSLSLWPVKIPNESDRKNNWSRSGIEAANHAQKSWVRVQANMDLGAYEIFEAQGKLVEPIWPDLTFEQILQTAFKDRIITSLEHPVIRTLKGLM